MRDTVSAICRCRTTWHERRQNLLQLKPLKGGDFYPVTQSLHPGLSCKQHPEKQLSHQRLVDPDEHKSYRAELSHGDLGKPGNNSLAFCILALPALIDEDSLQTTQVTNGHAERASLASAPACSCFEKSLTLSPFHNTNGQCPLVQSSVLRPVNNVCHASPPYAALVLQSVCGILSAYLETCANCLKVCPGDVLCKMIGGAALIIAHCSRGSGVLVCILAGCAMPRPFRSFYLSE